MNFPSLASILIVSSTLALTACPAGSDETESGTDSASSTDATTTGTASVSSTDGTTTGVTTATDDSGTPTSGSTSDVTTGPGTVTNVTDTSSTAPGTDTGTTDTDTGDSSGTTGEPGPVEASCGNACDTVMACEPELYATKEECVQECSEAASPDPACQTAAAAFNDCIAGFTCEQLEASDEGDFGECADEFNAYLASCE